MEQIQNYYLLNSGSTSPTSLGFLSDLLLSVPNLLLGLVSPLPDLLPNPLSGLRHPLRKPLLRLRTPFLSLSKLPRDLLPRLHAPFTNVREHL